MFSPFGSCKHYSDGIVYELNRRGADVRLYDERPSQKNWVKIYMNLFKHYSPRYFSDYVERILQENINFNPDYILIVRGQGFDKNILKLLRTKMPDTKLIYFQWDPLNGRDVSDILDLYDAAYAFDPQDVHANPKFKFRPTFFTPEYELMENAKDPIYDIVFVGTLYNNRWTVLKRMRSYFETSGIKCYMHLYMASWTLYLWDFIFRGSFVNPKKMKFHMMSYKDNVMLVEKSKAILDIVYSKQTGLSMRAYEAMASRRKYITNNEYVKEYDFYDESNILIIDKDNPKIPENFLRTPFKYVDPSIMRKYSIAGFIDDVFGNI